MINRFTRRSPYDLGLYTPPVEAIQKSMEVMQRQYEINYQVADSLKNQFIPSLPQDRSLANDIQKKWSTKVDDIVSKYKGNYAQASQDLRRLQAEMRNDLNPGGVAHAITSNFSSYQNWLKDQRERLEKQRIIGEDLNLANAYIMKNYQGIGQIDPVTGSFNKINTEEVADYQDPNEIIDKVYKEFKPEKGKTAYTKFQNGLQTQVEEEFESMDPNRLNIAFQQALFSDPKYVTYMRQRSKFLDVPDEQMVESIAALTGQRANALGYTNRFNSSKSERDPLALINARAAADRVNIKYRNDLDKQRDFENFQREQQQNFLRYEDTQKGMQAKPIDQSVLKDWRSGIGSSSTSPEISGVVNSITGQPYYSNRTTKSSTTSVEEETLLDFLNKDPEKADKLLKAKNIDPVLFRQMQNDKSNDFRDEYIAKYGVDKEWTKKFDQDLFWDYEKEAKANHSLFQTYSYNVPDVVKKQVIGEAVRQSVGDNQTEVYIPGSTVTLQALPSEIKEELIDMEKGKIKGMDLIDVRYVTPQAGYTAAGHKVVLPSGKSFVLVDQNMSTNQLGKRFNKAFGSLFNEGLKEGSDFVDVPFIDETGQPRMRPAIPVREFERNNGKYDLAIKYKDIETGKYIQTYVPTRNGIEGQDLIMNMPSVLQLYQQQFQRLGYQKERGNVTPNRYHENYQV